MKAGSHFVAEVWAPHHGVADKVIDALGRRAAFVLEGACAEAYYDIVGEVQVGAYEVTLEDLPPFFATRTLRDITIIHVWAPVR